MVLADSAQAIHYLPHTIKFELEPDYKSIPDEELIADLRRVASDLEKNSLSQREYKKHGKFVIAVFWSRFGSWINSLARGFTSLWGMA